MLPHHHQVKSLPLLSKNCFYLPCTAQSLFTLIVPMSVNKTDIRFCGLWNKNKQILLMIIKYPPVIRSIVIMFTIHCLSENDETGKKSGPFRWELNWNTKYQSNLCWLIDMLHVYRCNNNTHPLLKKRISFIMFRYGKKVFSPLFNKAPVSLRAFFFQQYLLDQQR